MKKIFKSIEDKFPKLGLVIAWNQPMLKSGDEYIFGASAATNHILIAPWDQKVLKEFAPYFAEYRVNKKTIALPNDWPVDEKILQKMIKASIKK